MPSEVSLPQHLIFLLDTVLTVSNGDLCGNALKIAETYSDHLSENPQLAFIKPAQVD